MRLFLSFLIVMICSQISTAQCTTPTISANGPIAFCQGESVTLSTAVATNANYQWKLNGTTNVGVNSASFNAIASGSYTVTVTDASDGLGGTCAPSTSAATIVTVNELPTAPTSLNNFSSCGSGAVTLTATAPSGSTIDWYSAAIGGTLLLSGASSFTTPSISATTTYYAEAKNTTTNCVSSTRAAVVATVHVVPSAPTGTAGSRCGSGTVPL